VGALPPGSLFLVRKATDVWEHVGLIEAATPNALRTIEGNTDHNGSSNGYEATRRTRGYAGKDFIVW
jgi:hypothetical protein